MHDYAEWMQSQYSPTGQFCCDLSDGRPLHEDEIRTVDDHLEVFWSRRHWEDAPEQGMWLVVPRNAMLPQLSPVGYPVVWILGGRVWCFATSGAV